MSLNQEELAEAKKAIEDGFTDKYMFGLDRRGYNKEHPRIMQRDGKIIEGEDFTPLAPTKPERPMTAQRAQTRNQLLNQRRQSNLTDMQQTYGSGLGPAFYKDVDRKAMEKARKSVDDVNLKNLMNKHRPENRKQAYQHEMRKKLGLALDSAEISVKIQLPEEARQAAKTKHALIRQRLLQNVQSLNANNDQSLIQKKEKERIKDADERVRVPEDQLAAKKNKTKRSLQT